MPHEITRTGFNISADGLFILAIFLLGLVFTMPHAANAQVQDVAGAVPTPMVVPEMFAHCNPEVNPAATIVQRTLLIANSTRADFHVTAIKQFTTELKIRKFNNTNLDKGISEYRSENPDKTSIFHVKDGDQFAVSIDMLSSCLEISDLNITYLAGSEPSGLSLVGNDNGYINFATRTGCNHAGSDLKTCNTYVGN